MNLTPLFCVQLALALSSSFLHSRANASTLVNASENSSASLPAKSHSLQAPDSDLISAHREANEDPDLAAKRSLKGRGGGFGSRRPGDVISEQIMLSNLDVSKFADWSGATSIQSGFAKIRDHRFLADKKHEQFTRRISWLYPDDGCFVRAALASETLQEIGDAAPSKLFVFGSLTAQTPFSPTGSVSWWYHVADAYQKDGQVWVFDPALETSTPLRLEVWLELINGSDPSTKVSVCDSSAVSPKSLCHHEILRSHAELVQMEDRYLEKEWDRLELLGKDPEMILGNQPPWVLEAD